MKHFGSAHSTAEERSVLLLSSVGVVSFGWAVSCGFSYCLSIPESLRASPVAAPVELPTRRRIQIALRTGRVRATPCIAPGRQDFIHFTPHRRCRTDGRGRPASHSPTALVRRHRRSPCCEAPDKLITNRRRCVRRVDNNVVRETNGPPEYGRKRQLASSQTAIK